MAARSAADHGGARQEGRRPRGADGEDRQGRVRSRQPERKRRGLDRDWIPLRQAPVAERSESMGLARRRPPGRCDGECERSLNKIAEGVLKKATIIELRDPVTSPPLPVPDLFALGQLPPKSCPQLFKVPLTTGWIGPGRMQDAAIARNDSRPTPSV